MLQYYTLHNWLNLSMQNRRYKDLEDAEESQISRANWKLYTEFSEFQLCGVSAPLTPELFKGQWHNVVCQLYLNFNFFNFIFV